MYSVSTVLLQRRNGYVTEGACMIFLMKSRIKFMKHFYIIHCIFIFLYYHISVIEVT